MCEREKNQGIRCHKKITRAYPFFQLLKPNIIVKFITITNNGKKYRDEK